VSIFRLGLGDLQNDGKTVVLLRFGGIGTLAVERVIEPLYLEAFLRRRLGRDR